MVEANNQRKAFLDMLAWSEGTDNGRQKTRNHGYDVIVGRRAVTGLRSPRKLVASDKTQINRRRTLQLLSRWWDAYRRQRPERLLRIRTLWLVQQIKGVALYL